MQTLYTIDSISDEAKEAEYEKILNKKFDQTRQLFVYLVYFLTEAARYAETDARLRASKHLPSAEDLHVNTKIAGNELLWAILEEPSFKASIKEYKPEQIINTDLLKKIYHELTASEDYNEYISEDFRARKTEKDILQFLFSALMLPNEDFTNHLEEYFINWDDDAEMLNLLMNNYLQKPHGLYLNDLVSKEKMDFARSLLFTTLEKKDNSMELLKPKLKNWDADRIAALDLIIIQMGICEFLFFETIPTKVTINEYIDLAKEYSTPQSGQFINGILDNIHKELTAKGAIQKKSFRNSTL